MARTIEGMFAMRDKSVLYRGYQIRIYPTSNALNQVAQKWRYEYRRFTSSPSQSRQRDKWICPNDNPFDDPSTCLTKAKEAVDKVIEKGE